LWHRLVDRDLKPHEEQELAELRDIMLSRAALLAGRTLWLGDTDTIRNRESASFNCAFMRVATVHDVVDFFWLLLQGCGVGGRPVVNCLSGFPTYIPLLDVIRSTRTKKGGAEENEESWDPTTKTWTISVGDSAEAWAKSVGKLLAGKYPGCERLVLDFSAIRPAGERLRGYGWISNGDASLVAAYRQIVHILNRRVDKLLKYHDIHDILNLLGTVLSTRRSAQIMLHDYDEPGWDTFSTFKLDHVKAGRPWRSQSNNTLCFHSQPTKEELRGVFFLMEKSGGSEPGMLNAQLAKEKSPWFHGLNPCAEILLPDKGFCNLVEVDIAHPAHRKFTQLLRTLWLMARANYRQTCVNLDDGVLQRAWHENNEFLRLCGVSITGIVRRHDLSPHDFSVMRSQARHGAESMARELNLPLPKAVTTIKPSGTLSKIMDTTEGIHKPPGRYVFNAVEFADTDPLIAALAEANYSIVDHPYKPATKLIRFPIEYPEVSFGFPLGGEDIDDDPAITQLERYITLMDYWAEHNISCTVSYSPEEVPQIIDWLYDNWYRYIGVAFSPRQSHVATPEFPYLPQQVVTKEEFEFYAESLRRPCWPDETPHSPVDTDCGTACPVV
jgi:ribonucleoside-triphosphate reductase